MWRQELPVAAIAGTVLAGSLAYAGPPASLEPLAFLVGEWEASGGGAPGQGSGKVVFARAVQDRLILRTSYAEYPASGATASSRHDDLLVIYEAPGGGARADYYDSEGHVIRYVVTSPTPGEAMFVSEPAAGGPRYRLRYALARDGVLDGEFAIAPPGEPSAFKPYLAWKSTRAKAARPSP